MDNGWIWLILILAAIVGRLLLKRLSTAELAKKPPEFRSGNSGQNGAYAPYEVPRDSPAESSVQAKPLVEQDAGPTPGPLGLCGGDTDLRFRSGRGSFRG